MSDERLRSKVEVDNGNSNTRCQLSTSTSTSNLNLTLKAWPVIAAATIGLCYLTQTVAGWFGIELPDQANIDLVKRYAGWNWAFAFLCLQVLVLMPAIEELIFRKGIYSALGRVVARSNDSTTNRRIVKAMAVLSAVLFSGAHYFFQPFPDSAFLALFLFGLAQCWLYRKTGHLWCAMLNHALFNLTNLILLFIIPNS